MDKTIRDQKLTFSEWQALWKKRHCRGCDTGVPNPLVCYVCVGIQWQRFFTCAKCGRYHVMAEQEVCGGYYDTGGCLCAKCRAIIQAVKVCHAYSRAGYSEGHIIHRYSEQEIAREVKLFFRGGNLWAKVFCRFCGKKVAVVKLGCVCYHEQRQHEHKYSSQKCLECWASYSQLTRQLDGREWQAKYNEYSEWWDWQQETAANRSIREAYQFFGVGGGYWAACSFCDLAIKGQEKNKQPLEKNMVRFWSQDKQDERLICDYCLRKREVVTELGITHKIVAFWLRQGFSQCENCGKKLVAALRHSRPKNRNRALLFWGLKGIGKYILCLECIRDNYRENLTSEKRKVLTKYLKRGYV